MCRALVSELHLEVLRHGMLTRSFGEDDIVESVQPSCMGVVQNYTLTDGGELVFRGGSDEGFGLGDPAGLLIVKRSCEALAELRADDLAEFLWREGQTLGADASPDAFCAPRECATGARSSLVPRRRRKKRRNSGASGAGTPGRAPAGPAASADDPMRTADYARALEKLDADGTLSNLLAQERAEPLSNMEPPQRRRIESAVADLRCSLCRAAALELQTAAAARAAAQGRRRSGPWRLEHELLELAEDVCAEREDLSRPTIPLPGGGAVPPPALPPAWTARYSIVRAVSVPPAGEPARGVGARAERAWRLVRHRGGRAAAEAADDGGGASAEGSAPLRRAALEASGLSAFGAAEGADRASAEERPLVLKLGCREIRARAAALAEAAYLAFAERAASDVACLAVPPQAGLAGLRAAGCDVSAGIAARFCREACGEDAAARQLGATEAAGGVCEV
jgi:hypothetical protein